MEALKTSTAALPLTRRTTTFESGTSWGTQPPSSGMRSGPRVSVEPAGRAVVTGPGPGPVGPVVGSGPGWVGTGPGPVGPCPPGPGTPGPTPGCGIAALTSCAPKYMARMIPATNAVGR